MRNQARMQVTQQILEDSYWMALSLREFGNGG